MKIVSTVIAALAIASGSAMAADPAPLTLSELDAVSAGAKAHANGSSSVYWSHYSVDVDNYTSAHAKGRTLEAAEASQGSLVEAASVGGYVIWAASGYTASHAAAISEGHYKHYKRKY